MGLSNKHLPEMWEHLPGTLTEDIQYTGRMLLYRAGEVVADEYLATDVNASTAAWATIITGTALTGGLEIATLAGDIKLNPDGNVLISDDVYMAEDAYFGDGDYIYQGTGNDTYYGFDGTDFTHYYASMAVDVAGAGYRLTLPVGGTVSAGTTGKAGGFGIFTAGAGSAAKASSAAAGGAGGYWNFICGNGAAGDGAGADGKTGYFLLTGGTWIEGGTDDYTFGITATLNAAEAAGGTDVYRLIKGSMTSTTVTGWDTVYLLDLLDDNTTKFNVDQSGLCTPANGTYCADNIPVRFGNSTAAPDAEFYSDGTCLALELDTIPGLKIDRLAISDYKSLTGVNALDVYFRMQSALDSNCTGGSFVLTCGAKHGSGTDGVIVTRSGKIYIEPQASAGNTYLTIDPATTLGTEIRLDFGSSITTGLALSWGGIKGLILDDASPAAFAAGADANGLSTYWRGQDGGAATATGMSGASLYWKAGDGSAGAGTSAGGVGGSFNFDVGQGLAGAGGGADGKTGSFVISGANWIEGGTDDYTFYVNATLNATEAAGGTDVYRLLKGVLTETNKTGYNTVYLLDLIVGSTSKFAVDDSGTLIPAGGVFLADDVSLKLGNTSAAPDATIEWDTARTPNCLLVTSADMAIDLSAAFTLEATTAVSLYGTSFFFGPAAMTANQGMTIDVDTVDTEARFNINGTVMTTGFAFSWTDVYGLKIDDATIATYAATAAAGKDIFARFQDGAANGAGAGYAAGTVTVTTGTGGAGTGAAGGAGGSLAVQLGQGGTGTSSGAQGTMTVNGPVSITPATAAAGLTIDQNNNTDGLYIDSEATGSYAIRATGSSVALLTQDLTSGYGLTVLRNINEAGSIALVRFYCDHTAETKATLELGNDGTTNPPHISTRATNENLRIMPNGTGEVQFSYNSVRNFAFSGAAVAAYAAAADTAGQAWYAALQNGGTVSSGTTGMAGASGLIYTGTGSAAKGGSGANGGAGGILKVICGNGGAGDGAGSAGANGSFQVWHGTEGAGDYVELIHTSAIGRIKSGSGGLQVQTPNYTWTFDDAGTLYNGANTGSIGGTASELLNIRMGEDTSTGPVSTSGLYLGLAQESRLRWNKDATGYPAASLILGLNAVGSAAKDTIALSSAAITGFAALTNVNGSDLYSAMQSGLDNNKNGGSLYWSGGTAHGSGTGGSLFLTPGGTTSGARGAVVVYQSNITTTPTDALVLENATASTESVTVQDSPAIRFRAHAWDTPTDLVDRYVDWRIYAIPASGATVTSLLYFQHSLNGAGYTSPIVFSSSGNIRVLSAICDSSDNAVLNPGNSTLTATANNTTLTVQARSFTAADSAIEACTGAWTHSSLEGVAFELKPVWNASGTASETCLKINSTSTAVGSGAYLLINALDDTASRWSLGGDGKMLGTVTQSIAAAGSEWNLAAGTTTITAGVTAIHGLQIDQMTVTAGSALTADAAASLYIANAPVAGGSATVTAAYSIWVDAGNVRFDGSLGDTTNRVVKGWFTDLESTSAPTVGGSACYYVGGTDVAVADGGTGVSSWAVGDIVHATGATTLAGLADVAVGAVLVSGGVGVVSSWSVSPSVTSLTLTPTAALVGLTMTAALQTNTAGVIDLNVTAAATGVVGFDCSMTTPAAGLGDGESMYAHSIGLIGDASDHANSSVMAINLGWTANGGAAKAYGLYCNDTDFLYGVYNMAPTYLGGLTTTAGGRVHKRTSVTSSSYDVLTTDEIIGVDYEGAVAIQLMTATLAAGRVYTIKDEGGHASANTITISTEAAETIDGAATATITTNYNSISLYSDGTNWFIF